MQIIEQSHSRLAIRFGSAVLPAMIFVGALILGLALAIYGSSSDNILLLIAGVLFMFTGLLRLAREHYVTLTFDRFEGTLNVAQRRYMVPSAEDFRLSDIRHVEAICAGGQPVDSVPPGTKTRCDLVLDFISLPDYAVKRNLKRDEAADAVRLIRQFLEWET